MSRPLNNPKTLFNLCVEECVWTLYAGRCLGEARLLPPALKTTVLEVSATKGLVNEDILRALVHRDTPKLKLGWAVTVDDGMLRAIAAGRCRRLAVLNLSTFGREKDAVTAAGLLELFPAVGANLTELVLFRCPAVDDAVVAQVARCCPRLRTLHLGRCREVTDASLFALGDLEGLVKLYVNGTKVSDAGLLALAKGSSRETLRELHVDDSPMTKYGSMVARQLCSKLVIRVFSSALED